MPQQKLEDILQFSNVVRCEKYLTDNKHKSPHFARRYARISVLELKYSADKSKTLTSNFLPLIVKDNCWQESMNVIVQRIMCKSVLEMRYYEFSGIVHPERKTRILSPQGLLGFKFEGSPQEFVVRRRGCNTKRYPLGYWAEKIMWGEIIYLSFQNLCL